MPVCEWNKCGFYSSSRGMTRGTEEARGQDPTRLGTYLFLSLHHVQPAHGHGALLIQRGAPRGHDSHRSAPCNLPMAAEPFWYKEGPRGVTTVTAAPRATCPWPRSPFDTKRGPEGSWQSPQRPEPSKRTPPNVGSVGCPDSQETRGGHPHVINPYPYRGANALARGAVCLWRTGSRPYPTMSQGIPPWHPGGWVAPRYRFLFFNP